VNHDDVCVARKSLQPISHGILSLFPTRNDLSCLLELILFDNLLQTIVEIFLSDNQHNRSNERRSFKFVERVYEDGFPGQREKLLLGGFLEAMPEAIASTCRNDNGIRFRHRSEEPAKYSRESNSKEMRVGEAGKRRECIKKFDGPLMISVFDSCCIPTLPNGSLILAF
jgi:hypothetical protein